MNTIRELKQQEKYKTMLKRKNKEKKIYKDKNASLQFEKQKLYRALLNREREIERLNNIIKEVREYITGYESISTIQGLENIEANKDLDEKTLNEMVRRYMIVHDKLLEILDKGE